MINPDPQSTFELPVCRPGRDEKDWPKLIFRTMNAREYAAFDKGSKAALDNESGVDGHELVEDLCELIRGQLVGWEGFGVEYDPAELDVVCTVGDLIQVCQELPVKQMLGELDAKKSALASRSNSGGVATDAGTESAPTATSNSSA